MAHSGEAVETVSELDSDKQRALHKRWVTEIKLYEKKREKFDSNAKKVVKRYKREKVESRAKTNRKFNILWSNIETLAPTVYARTPKAEVTRRHRDQDPVGRVASMIIERSVEYFLDCKDTFDETIQDCRDDYLLVGLGSAWQRYVPHMKTVTPDPIGVEPIYPEAMPADGLQISNEQTEPEGFLDAEGNRYDAAEINDVGQYAVTPDPYEAIDYEEVIDDYVHWSDFGHNAGARTWNEVYAVWRKAYMTREELHERFDSVLGREEVKKIPLDAKPEDMGDDDNGSMFCKATVYEIWDKSAKQALWLHKAYERGSLDTRDDPLGLEEFFPCPRPMFATLAHDNLIPVADYIQYQDQAEEIDELTGRIAHLTGALRVRGIYAADIEEIKRLFDDAREADLIPVENWSMYVEKGGLQNAISWVPLKDIADALIMLYEARERAKQDLYEITGLSDIIRGQSDPDETARAQTIKAQFGSGRVRKKQKEIARFARDIIRIKAEIIAEHFAPETLLTIANAESFPDEDKPHIGAAIDLIKSDQIRNFRVEIETDSTIAADEQADKEARIEFITAITNFAQAWGPILQQTPQLAPMGSEILKFAIRGFKTGEALEAIVEQTMENLMQPQPPAPPDPAGQMEGQARAMDAQAKMAQAEASVVKSGNEVAKAQIEAATLPTRLDAPETFDQAQSIMKGGL